MSTKIRIKNALISVSDKAGLGPLCSALHQNGVTLYSTGGTAAHIEKECGLPVKSVESVTQFPEMMDGRVKTLHPHVFGGILARRDNEKDLAQAGERQIPLFDLIVVNLYPFSSYLGEVDTKQSSFVDIGGPSMIRAASKNFESVTVLSDPADYDEFLKDYSEHEGHTDRPLRKLLAARSFERTSRYDAMIASEWSGNEFPSSLSLGNQNTLRYGENPHQKAIWSGKKDWKVLQGKELSYNNLLDTEAALGIVNDFSAPAVSIIKHNNPCGVASFDGALEDIFEKALACDSKSAFGGIVATNQEVNATTAKKMSEIFLEVIIAKSFHPDAVEIFSKKKNLRLISWENPTTSPLTARKALGGWLVQEEDLQTSPENTWTTVTTTEPPAQVMNDLRFAWSVCKHVRSNAIVLAKEGATIGIGAGQMSRVDAVELAIKKSQSSLNGAVLASDAFFPFRDNIDLLKGREIAAVIQPGGSKRDGEVIDACNELGIAMVFTGRRHFRH